MGTMKQKKLAEEIVKNMASNKPISAGQMLEKVGYATSVAEAKPSEIIESIGVQEELEKMGFTEMRAKKTVAEIMNNIEAEPNARLKAADMTFKVHGSYAPEKSASVNLDLRGNISDPQLELLREKYEEELKAKLLQ